MGHLLALRLERQRDQRFRIRLDLDGLAVGPQRHLIRRRPEIQDRTKRLRFGPEAVVVELPIPVEVPQEAVAGTEVPRLDVPAAIGPRLGRLAQTQVDNVNST